MATDRGPQNCAGNCSPRQLIEVQKAEEGEQFVPGEILRGCEFGDLSWLVDQGPALESWDPSTWFSQPLAAEPLQSGFHVLLPDLELPSDSVVRLTRFRI